MWLRASRSQQRRLLMEKNRRKDQEETGRRRRREGDEEDCCLSLIVPVSVSLQERSAKFLTTAEEMIADVEHSEGGGHGKQLAGVLYPGKRPRTPSEMHRLWTDLHRMVGPVSDSSVVFLKTTSDLQHHRSSISGSRY